MDQANRFAYQGGNLDLSGARPRGVPALAPSYGFGPYQYRGNRCVIVVTEVAAAALREVMPRELEPAPGNLAVWCLFDCPQVNGLEPHAFAMPCIPCRYGDFVGQYVPYLYTSTEASLTGYREAQGWPARLADVRVQESGGKVRASVHRGGRELIGASGTVGGERITHLDFLPIILYKEIPSIDTRGRDVGCLVASTSLFENLDYRSGGGELHFDETSVDPVIRLKPLKVIQLLYGTMDDLYPETIRVLHRY
jgi:acetoacetate decarboxylase